MVRWSRLGSNQRPPACEAGALPLSYETGAERRTRTKISTHRGTGRKYRPSYGSGAPMVSWNLCGPAQVDYRRASHRATISSVARGCGAVGSAQPCQGWGRGFESRHPLEGANGINPAVEWPSGEATACKAVHTGSIPVSTSRFVSPARLAQRESASLTRKRSLVQSQYRAPRLTSKSGPPGSAWQAPLRCRSRPHQRFCGDCRNHSRLLIRARLAVRHGAGRRRTGVNEIT